MVKKSPRHMILFLVILFFLIPVTSWGLTRGPDGFGYTLKDSTEKGMPEFQWTDISTSRTAHWLTGKDGSYDDSVFGPIAIGFSFHYYGNEYKELYISANGLISFSPIKSAALADDNKPFNLFPYEGDSLNGVINMIAGLWTNLNPSGV